MGCGKKIYLVVLVFFFSLNTCFLCHQYLDSITLDIQMIIFVEQRHNCELFISVQYKMFGVIHRLVDVKVKVFFEKIFIG
jgi:hypothetical protein